MGARILVVEDDAEARKLYSRSIRGKQEYVVHEAADPAEARSLMESYSYDLVLTDLSFAKGRLEGLSLIEKLAAQQLRPGIVACTDYEIARSMALSRGADAFLSKPTHPGELLEVVGKVLDQRKPVSAQLAESEKESQIDELLRLDATQLYVQPIYRIASKPALLAGVEFFTRGPAGSRIERPDVLFALAREAHKECVLDRHCVHNIFAAGRHIPPPLRLSINVHASTLCSPPNFAHFLSSAADKAQIDLARVTVEIVEHAPAWNQQEFLETLDKLRELGVRIALDDIGLGQSNFQMMIDAQPDCFKLDRYFVHNCHAERGRRAVIASIAKLASEFGAEVIAEGVATQEELHELQSLGITMAQGYIFCPPKSLAAGWDSVVTYDPAPPVPPANETENGTETESMLADAHGAQNGAAQGARAGLSAPPSH